MFFFYLILFFFFILNMQTFQQAFLFTHGSVDEAGCKNAACSGFSALLWKTDVVVFYTLASRAFFPLLSHAVQKRCSTMSTIFICSVHQIWEWSAMLPSSPHKHLMLKKKRLLGIRYCIHKRIIICNRCLELVQFLQVNNGPFNQTPCGALRQASHVLWLSKLGSCLSKHFFQFFENNSHIFNNRFKVLGFAVLYTTWHLAITPMFGSSQNCCHKV